MNVPDYYTYTMDGLDKKSPVSKNGTETQFLFRDISNIYPTTNFRMELLSDPVYRVTSFPPLNCTKVGNIDTRNSDTISLKQS